MVFQCCRASSWLWGLHGPAERPVSSSKLWLRRLQAWSVGTGALAALDITLPCMVEDGGRTQWSCSQSPSTMRRQHGLNSWYFLLIFLALESLLRFHLRAIFPILVIQVSSRATMHALACSQKAHDLQHLAVCNQCMFYSIFVCMCVYLLLFIYFLIYYGHGHGEGKSLRKPWQKTTYLFIHLIYIYIFIYLFIHSFIHVFMHTHKQIHRLK